MKKTIISIITIVLLSFNSLTVVAYTNDQELINDQGVQCIEKDAESWRYHDGCIRTDNKNTNKKLTATSITPWSKYGDDYYNDKGMVISGALNKGIDVSAWQGDIDWDKVSADGIEFAIIRCGYGSDKTDYDDSKWKRNAQECERLGIPYGVYLYSYAESINDVKSEAQHTLRLLDGFNPTFPVYYDLEDTKTVLKQGRNSIIDFANTWCSIIEDNGYAAGIYANLNWFDNYLNDDSLSAYEHWVAQWNSTCQYSGEYGLWQCTSSGSVDGISGNVDLDFNYIDIENGRTHEGEEPILNVVRLFGQTAYGTASSIVDYAASSNAGNLLKPDANGDTYVFLCNGEAFPDALGASALASYYNAPILLTKSKSLPNETKEELKKLKPTKIIIIGGRSVVPDSVAKDAIGAAGISSDIPIDRIWGQTMYDTSREIYKRGNEVGAWGEGRTKTCILASAAGFQDSLSISPYAFSNQAPLFLVDAKTKKLDNDMVNTIKSGNFDRAIIVGGEKVVDDEVLNQIGIETSVRLGGATGYDTSLLVAKWVCGENIGAYSEEVFSPDNILDVGNSIAFASGTDFPDGLVVGVLQGAVEGPTILVRNETTTLNNISKWLKNYNGSVSTMHILGGNSVMPSKLGKVLIEMTSYGSINWQPTGVERFVGVKRRNTL